MQVNINENRLVSLFKKLVETNSPSGDERAVCDLIKAELEKLNIIVVEDDAGQKINGSAGNLYAYVNGDLNLPPILFSAHMDTVEPSKNKKCLIDSNGTIQSDGTTVLGSDDFAGVSAIIEALKVLNENNIPHRSVELLFSVSEETYCNGAKEFDFSKIKSKDAYVFDLSGSVGDGAYCAPTILSFQAEIIGKSSHAGFASEKGIHSIKAMADAISKIKCGKIGDDTTVNIGTIVGGTATNIVPDKCTVTGEIRSYLDEKAVEQYNSIAKIFANVANSYGATANLSFKRNVTAYETNLNHRVVSRFKNVCQNIGLVPNLVKSFGGSDNNVFAQNGITGIVTATAMNACHTTAEWTTIAQLAKASELALNLITSEE